MKWIGQNIYDLASKFRNIVDFSENVTFYQPVNGADPEISIGSSATERLRININYQGSASISAQGIGFKTFTESTTANDGKMTFSPDENYVLAIDDGGIDFQTGYGISINGADIITDSSGTATLSNIDALDATTEATIETAIDTLANLTSVGTIGTGVWNGTAIASAYLDSDTAHLTTTQVFTGDKTFSTKLIVLDSTASSATQGGKLNLISNDGAALGDDHRLGIVNFIAAEDASSSYVAGASIAAYADAAWSASENGTRLVVRTMDGNAAGQDVLTLDSDKLATFTGAVTVTGALSGTLATVSQPNITGVGTIGTGVWQGTTIKTAYIGDDQVTEDKLADTLLAEIDANTAKNSAPNIFGDYIKLLISDFATNKDGGNTKHGIGFDSAAGDDTYGIKVPNNNTELFAFVSIPKGMKATHVEIFGLRDRGVEVFEVQINATTVVSKGTGNCNTEFAINNSGESAGIAATATNLLAIEIDTVSTTADRVYGGRVKIAAQ